MSVDRIRSNDLIKQYKTGWLYIPDGDNLSNYWSGEVFRKIVFVEDWDIFIAFEAKATARSRKMEHWAVRVLQTTLTVGYGPTLQRAFEGCVSELMRSR